MNFVSKNIKKIMFLPIFCLFLLLFFTNCSGELSDNDLISIYKHYDNSWGGITYSQTGYANAKREKFTNACKKFGYSVEEFFNKYRNGGEQILRRYYKSKYKENSIRELPGNQYSGYGYRK